MHRKEGFIPMCKKGCIMQKLMLPFYTELPDLETVCCKPSCAHVALTAVICLT